MDILEVVKTLGAFVGLITGCFVVVDRFFWNSPIVYLRPEKHPAALRLVVRNVAKEAIFIKSIKCQPSTMGVSDSGSLDNAVQALRVETTFSTVIDRETEKILCMDQRKEVG